MRIHPLVVLAPFLSLILAGCPGGSVVPPYTPVGYPGYPGMGPTPDPDANPGWAPGADSALMDGLSLDDAHQQVRRYLTLHYPGAELVSVQSSQVAANARISRLGNWAFTYQMKQRTAETPAVQTVEIPSQFDTQFLTFTLSGTGVLQAPEAKTRLGHEAGTVQYNQVLPLSQAIKIAQSFGMGIGSQGVSVFLKPDASVGAVYALDNSLSAPGYGGKSAGTGSSYRGTFVIDAYTGDLLERPSNP